MSHKVKIISKEKLNHDVVRFHLERPANYNFSAGQAIELFIQHPEKKGPAPFTFTGLNSEQDLELTIKIYEHHKGLTASLAQLSINDEVFITEPWDSFTNKGPGIFIAGGAGITPFIALLRQMRVDGKVDGSHLYFSNKTSRDIFLHKELKAILGDRYVDILTRDTQQRLDEQLLSKHLERKQPYYVCGPPGFVDSMQQLLSRIGATQDLVNISL
jgi:ferredoxin-NADP reductase